MANKLSKQKMDALVKFLNHVHLGHVPRLRDIAAVLGTYAETPRFKSRADG